MIIKKLRKIAFVIMTALLINFCGNTTIMAGSMNVGEQSGEVKVWATDVLVSSEYRMDDTYISIYDSLYWMVDCKIYGYK